MPQRRETQGRSEEYVGRWIKERRVPRDRVVLATKVLFSKPIVFICIESCNVLSTFFFFNFSVASLSFYFINQEGGARADMDAYAFCFE